MKQRETNAVDTVAAAARAAARGESYDVGAIENALIEARLSMNDFETQVELAAKRAAWGRDFERLANASNKVQKAEAALAAERTKFEATQKAFFEKAQAIEADIRTASRDRDAAQTARGHLLDPNNVPGTIGEKYREATAKAEADAAAVEQVQRQLREIATRIKSEQEWIVQITGEGEAGGSLYRQLLPQKAPESMKLQDHRAALLRGQRRKAEAEGQLAEAQKKAALSKKVVEDMAPEVLKA